MLVFDVVVGGAVFAGVGYWVGGQTGAVIGFGLAVVGAVGNAIESRKKRKAVEAAAARDAMVPTPVFAGQSVSRRSAVGSRPDFVEIPGALDHVRFEYETQDGRIGTYTVAVTHAFDNKFTGFCFERMGERSFFFDAIRHDEVIRMTTGEVLSVDRWIDELEAA